MNYDNQYIGRDELKPAKPGIHWIAPTEIDRAANEMIKYIKDRYSGDWRYAIHPWMHPKFNKLLGVGGKPIYQFLNGYIELSKESRQNLSVSNKDYFRESLKDDYDFDNEQIDEYINAFFALKNSGKLPKSIIKPYTYKPTTIQEDISNVASSAMKPVRKTFLPWFAIITIGGIAAYGFSTSGIPRMVNE